MSNTGFLCPFIPGGIWVQVGSGTWASLLTAPVELLVSLTAGCWEKSTFIKLPHRGFVERFPFGWPVHRLVYVPNRGCPSNIQVIYATVMPYDPEGVLGSINSVLMAFLGLQVCRSFFVVVFL